MNRFLAPILGTTLALSPAVAQGAAPSDRPLELLSQETLGKVTLVVNDPSIGAHHSYVDEFTRDGDRFLVIDPQNVTPNVDCPAEASPASVPSSSSEAPAEPLEVKVYAGVGANEEELGSEYSLGSAAYGALGAQFRFPGSRFCLGLNGDIIVSGTGSGFEGGVATVGYCNDRFDVALQGGLSGEPRAPETALNGAPTLGLLARYDVLQIGQWGLNAGVSGRMDLYGGGVVPANVTVFLGATYNVQIERKKEDSAAEDLGPRLVISQVPYSFVPPSYVQTQEGSPEMKVKKAELIRLEEDIKKFAARNAWEAVESRYDQAVELGIPLTYEVYWLGANAARGLGDSQEAYERLLLARNLAGTSKEKEQTEDFIRAIETNYASVDIEIGKNGELLVSLMPFDPAYEASIRAAQELVTEEHRFVGLVPIIGDGGAVLTYTLNGLPIEGLVPLSTQQTTVIRVEK